MTPSSTWPPSRPKASRYTWKAEDEPRLSVATGSSADLEVIHEIKTDDPLSVEAYWHRRFSERRIKNKWFKLSAADVKRWRRGFYRMRARWRPT